MFTDMSRGIGKTQQAILAELTTTHRIWLSIAELAERVGCSGRRIHQAVRSLEQRRLVATTREHLGWKGVGEYGREELRVGDPWRTSGPVHGPEVPTSRVIRKGEPWHRGRDLVAAEDTELVRGGMPTWGVAVWMPEKRIAYLEDIRATVRAFGGAGNGNPAFRAELERLTGSPPASAPRTFTIPG